jgi:hypothetical protein
MAAASQEAPGFQLVPMAGDVSTREGALAWLGRRIRKLGLALVVGIAVTPIASALVAGIAYTLSYGELPSVARVVESSLAWTVVMVPILFIAVGLLARKYMKFAARVRPIVRAGSESHGAVVGVQFSSRKAKSGVLHGTITVSVAAEGTTWIAAIEESQGTKLPKVLVGTRATVWSLDGRAVIGASGSLFGSA